LKKAELKYYDYFEDGSKFYCCSLFLEKGSYSYEYNPNKRELRFKKIKKPNKILKSKVFILKPEVSRVIINIDILLRCIRSKIETQNIICDGLEVKEFLFKNFNYIRAFKEKDQKIRDTALKYVCDPSSVYEDPDSNDFGLVVDLIKCGGLKC
jgi:hypothetical protein